MLILYVSYFLYVLLGLLRLSLFNLVDLILCVWMWYQLDDWVLCRIYKKKHIAKAMEQKEEEYSTSQMDITAQNVNDSSEQQMMQFPRTSSLTHLLEMENYLAPFSHLSSDGSYNSTFDYQINSAYTGNYTDPFVKPQVFEVPNHFRGYDQ